MKVTRIAHTSMVELPDSVEDTAFGDSWYEMDALLYDADTLAHFAGRSCYQAWDMPSKKTRTNEGYLNNIINQGHFSVLEHASATYYVEGISRNLTHELIRHRHLSYSELSQRFVNMEDANFVIPPAARVDGVTSEGGLCPLTEYDVDEVDSYKELDNHPLTTYIQMVKRLEVEGFPRKQAREAARAYLPSSVETRIVVSGNHRVWRDMLMKRYSFQADAEIRELATLLLEDLRELAPATYQDFPDCPFD